MDDGLKVIGTDGKGFQNCYERRALAHYCAGLMRCYQIHQDLGYVPDNTNVVWLVELPAQRSDYVPQLVDGRGPAEQLRTALLFMRHVRES